MPFVADCKKVLPITLVAAGVGFVFGILFSGSEYISYNMKDVHNFIQTKNVELAHPEIGKPTRQLAPTVQPVIVPESERQPAQNSFHVNKGNDIQSLCSIPNVSGRVLSHDLNSWKINDAACLGKLNKTTSFVRANLRGPQKTPIYVYKSEEDVWVSGNIIRNGMWEGGWVTKIHSILSKDPEAVFIDIGANVGVFCLTAAKLGRRVIAIDALQGNIARLCKSVEAGNLKNNMVLIHNALSNKREKVALGVHKKNVGGTFVKKLNMDFKDEYVVNSILLDDLLDVFTFPKVVIKMDVETFEANILEGGQKFFQEVDVRYLLMEFSSHRKRQTGAFIIKFLKEHGLEPEISAGLLRDYSKWPGEVLFTKRRT